LLRVAWVADALLADLQGISNGETRADRVLDFCLSDRDAKRDLLGRLPINLQTALALREEQRRDFERLRDSSLSGARRLETARRFVRRREKIVDLIEETRPRFHRFESLAKQVFDQFDRVRGKVDSATRHEIAESMELGRHGVDRAALVCRQARQRYDDARSRLTVCNLRLVVSIAKKHVDRPDPGGKHGTDEGSREI